MCVGKLSMWSPTHIQVTVQRAKNLLSKGRKIGNDAFVLIQMGKEKFQTSIKEKTFDPEWYEECDLTIQENDRNVMFIVFHRNILGLDEFLGQVVISLDVVESYERPINKWYTLKSRNDKKKDKYRGELEIRISFVVRACDTQSLNDLSFIKKRRNSVKDFASSVGNKFQKMPSRRLSLHLSSFDPRASLEKFRKRHKVVNNIDSTNVKDTDDFVGDRGKFSQLKMKRTGSTYASTLSLPPSSMMTSPIREDENFEDFRQMEGNNSNSSNDSNLPNGITNCNMRRPEMKPQIYGQWTNRISAYAKESLVTRSVNCLLDFPENQSFASSEKKSKLGLRRHTLQFPDTPDTSSVKSHGYPKNGRSEVLESNVLDGYYKILSEGIPSEIVQEYDSMDHKDLVILAIKQQADIERQRDKILDLETYLDNLLARVMETTPRILQITYKTPNPACFR